MARKYKYKKLFVNLLALGILATGLVSGTLLVQKNQNPNEKAATTWPDCNTIRDQTTCRSWNCTWSTKYCRNLSTSQCGSFASSGCALRSCTTQNCTDGRQGCTLSGGKCSGSTCKYINGSTDPGFGACSGHPSTFSYTCDPNNVYVYKKLQCDGTACWVVSTTSCPSGQRCDLNSSTHCSTTRICTPGTKRCPLATGREYNYFEQCSSDGFRWNSVNCPSGQWCDGSSSTFCKSAQICSPNTRRCSSTSREIQKCNSAGTAWETTQSCYPEGTCRLTAYGPACS